MRALVAVAAVAALALTGCARDRYSTVYPDLVTARQQDAVDRGWIPEQLPEAAVDLRELHAPAEDWAVVRATLPDGAMPDGCVETEGDVGDPPSTPDWVPAGVADRGVPVACGVWAGTLDDETLVLWTYRASEADPA
jgi:hypothetical protein